MIFYFQKKKDLILDVAKLGSGSAAEASGVGAGAGAGGGGGAGKGAGGGWRLKRPLPPVSASPAPPSPPQNSRSLAALRQERTDDRTDRRWARLGGDSFLRGCVSKFHPPSGGAVCPLPFPNANLAGGQGTSVMSRRGWMGAARGDWGRGGPRQLHPLQPFSAAASRGRHRRPRRANPAPARDARTSQLPLLWWRKGTFRARRGVLSRVGKDGRDWTGAFRPFSRRFFHFSTPFTPPHAAPGRECWARRG